MPQVPLMLSLSKHACTAVARAPFGRLRVSGVGGRGILVVAVGVLLLAGPAVGASRLDDLRAKAQAAIERRDPVSAEVMLRAAIKNGAREDELRAHLGEALLAEGDRAEARKVLEGGSFAPGTEALGWRVRGQIALAEGNLRGAANAFDAALRANSKDSDLWVAIAALRFSGGEQLQSIEAADRAVALDPKNARALAFRGLLIREQYGLAAALPWFEAGLKVRPDDPALLGEYAATLGDMGDYRAMLIVCRKLAQVDPKNPRPAFLQAVLAARAGQTDLARTILQRTGNAFRDMPAAILLTGVLEYRAGNTNVAVEQFDRLVRLQPDNLEARQILLRAMARQGSDQPLVARFDGDADRAFAVPYTLRLVGQSWRRLGNKARADALFARAAHPMAHGPVPLPTQFSASVLGAAYIDAPGQAQTTVPYIRALLKEGRKDEAQAAADRLRDANPGAAEAHLLAGDVRTMRGDMAGALADYQNGASIRFNEQVLRRMDATLRALGRISDADSMTSRYLAQNPQSVLAMKLLAASWAKGPRRDAYVAVSRALAARGQPEAVQ
ncbi:tetratricopeptide repeat protein [Novosphingobium sp. NDB2Meth1]|uniref:tetratricopeptide repeat protein n=1 Tax=Novosphingobium sp. NDB2Meth1 TaxID=1892847 RepID=UPI00209B0785|nr:tetratricopeptide repeat protein [Novosphingobium sp. NDB2Meth1]